MGKQRAFITRSLKAVLAADSSSAVILTDKFNLDQNIELQIDAGLPNSGSTSTVNIQVTSSSDSILLHWGGIRSRKDKWILPHRHPAGTMLYKNQALRSPFVKEEYEAAQMELLEEMARGTSIENLRKKIMNKNYTSEGKEQLVFAPKSNIPDDLVQIQSFIRWEKAGKPNYSPENQLREFEEARKELQVELEKGASLDEIRKKITKGQYQKCCRQLNISLGQKIILMDL